MSTWFNPSSQTKLLLSFLRSQNQSITAEGPGYSVQAIDHDFKTHLTKRGRGIGEFETVMQTRDAVEGLHSPNPPLV